jgi:hypothetical protein
MRVFAPDPTSPTMLHPRSIYERDHLESTWPAGSSRNNLASKRSKDTLRLRRLISICSAWDMLFRRSSRALREGSRRRICSRNRHYAARRSASSTILRAVSLSCAFRSCWRVISPRSTACRSAWRINVRSTVPASIRSRIVRSGRVYL